MTHRLVVITSRLGDTKYSMYLTLILISEPMERTTGSLMYIEPNALSRKCIARHFQKQFNLDSIKSIALIAMWLKN